MNWFTRHFAKQPSTGVTAAQLETLTAQLVDRARITALESVREQFGVIKKAVDGYQQENLDLRKMVVDLSGTVKDLKKVIEGINKGFEASVKKMENLQNNVSEDRKGIAQALNGMNSRINDVIPATRARDASALISRLGKAEHETTSTPLAGPR